MDPEEALRQIRALASRIMDADPDKPYADDIDPYDAFRLAETVAELDIWLSRGGFLPEPWRWQYRLPFKRETR